MKTPTALPRETWFGLLVIVAVVALVVEKTAYGPPASEGRKRLLRDHEEGLYFIAAEQMAKRYLPDPALHWSVPLDGGQSQCEYLGRGVWDAVGTIAGEPGQVPAPPSWEAIFVPETGELLFVRAGNRTSGDVKAALRRAGLDPNQIQGAPGEK